ncbi:MAG: hypothetical protein HKN74_01655 [Acidimicrobiia bacterium]|nr:hypothetical protein [Acidimicrobiia bacterium]MBT8218152.1 hypothetical protein [Acidimicrobiia bacterium]NNF08968.1 hypothetical protein [Acidimicrobiia bacterium]NNL70906.1 hypothetical protein [Acidimicrobiia bacterium]
MNEANLRPAERRLMAMLDEGTPIDEIAARFRRSPAHIRRMIRWTRHPRPAANSRKAPDALESRVLTLLAQGETHDQIGEKFRRSGRFIRQVEAFAHLKRGTSVAAFDHARRLLKQAGEEARTPNSEPRLPHPDVTSQED